MNGDIESTIAALVVEIQSKMGEAKRHEQEAEECRASCVKAKAAVNALEMVQGRPARYTDFEIGGGYGSAAVKEKRTYKPRAPRGTGDVERTQASAETRRICDAVADFLRAKAVPLSSESIYSGMLAIGFSWPAEWAGKNAIRCLGQTLKWDGRFNRDNGIGWGVNA